MRAGDSRINVQPGLTSLHVLFLREHNRLAKAYEAQDPTATDDLLFYRARRMVVAELQSIAFEEYLPALLGRGVPEPKANSNSTQVPARVPTEFSTAAFRFGHSQCGDFVFRLGPNFTSSAAAGHAPLRLKDAYFRPELVEESGVEVFLRGAMYHRARKVCPWSPCCTHGVAAFTIAALRAWDRRARGRRAAWNRRARGRRAAFTVLLRS